VLLDTSNNSIVLTKRTKHLAYHAGEICFPGGQFHPNDRSLQCTALRELEEELGVHSSRLTSIIPLKPVMTLTGFCISPWFAKISSINPFKIQVSEVEETVFVDFPKACLHENYKKLMFRRNGYAISTEQFAYEGYKIWGATAKIMHQLCDLSIDAQNDR